MAAIKICGITRLEDALFIARCGADALGFIFYPGSPRYIPPDNARAIISELRATTPGMSGTEETIFGSSSRITVVGVFVDEAVDTVREISDYCGLDLIQLHGKETPDDCRQFPAERVIKALAPKTANDLLLLSEYKVRAILVDAYDPKRYGGTGKTSNWDLAVKVKRSAMLILSGGLHIGNIREALASVGPDAVDINSGVEVSPGIKDHDKAKAIINLIRNEP